MPHNWAQRIEAPTQPFNSRGFIPTRDPGARDRAKPLPWRVLSATTKARIPNALTLSRLALAAAFFAVLSLPAPGLPPSWALWAAAALFIVAAVTDALDGHLARKWSVVSRFGRIVDPFADKVLVLGAFVMLAGPAFAAPSDAGRLMLSGVEPWMAIVILARELLVTSLRGLAEGQGIDFSALKAGKLKMIIQSCAVPLILVLLALSAGTPEQGVRWANTGIAWGVTLITAWSAVPYVQKAIRAGA